MRDDLWLKNRMEYIWNKYFPDLEKENKILVGFKGKWKNKFGHIKMVGKNTEIVVNSLFKDDRVPEFIVDNTLAHEIVHYLHGFQSPRKQMFEHPHKGNIVNKELKDRGVINGLRMEKDWVKGRWVDIYKSYFPGKRFRTKPGRVYIKSRSISWF